MLEHERRMRAAEGGLYPWVPGDGTVLDVG